MSEGLSPESNIGDLVDYLLENEIDIHILVPDDRIQSLQIRVDCTDAYNRPIRCVKCIDMIKYKSVVPEVQNVVIMQTIRELVKELTILR